MATTGHNQFSFDNLTVIGNATRVVEAVWPDPPLLCWCTIEVEIDDGQGNLLVASTRVIAFPLRLTLANPHQTPGTSVFTAHGTGRLAAVTPVDPSARTGEDLRAGSRRIRPSRARGSTGRP